MSISSIQHTSTAPIFGEHRTSVEPGQEDIVALRHMQARLRRSIAPAENAAAALPHTTYASEPEGRQHRIVLLNNTALRVGNEFTFVGFFGQKRAAAEVRSLDALDAELIRELGQYPQMLSYSSLELAGGSWGNLVVMSSPQGAVDWAGSARHAYAAYTIAPACYTSIRLYSGALTLKNSVDDTLHILRTKHIDYTETTHT